MKYVFSFLLVMSFCCADLVDHLQTNISGKKKNSPLSNIDYIYLINLDHRPEKLQSALSELKPYGITPHRFSAIYGANLSKEAFDEVGVKFSPEMFDRQWVAQFTPEKQNAFLLDGQYDKTYFARWVSSGAIGCSLSHLSILQDAYNRGFKTIWVMEDDIAVKSDPGALNALIVKLDKLVGKDGWDVLYTDTDGIDRTLYGQENNPEEDLKADYRFFWRPDFGYPDQERLSKRTILNEDFLKIGSRCRTHSMIIRRSGMKKILDHAKSHGLFLPIDNEIALTPGINLVNLREDIVTVNESVSDIKGPTAIPWVQYKQDTLAELQNILGWRDAYKAERIMESVYEKKPTLCVEIGAFGGAKTYPIARALAFQKSGIVYAIDAWSADVVIEGLQNAEQIKFWKEINFDAILSSLQNLISRAHIEDYCHLVCKRSRDAAALFENNSIDFLYIDGVNSSLGSFEDVLIYLPKVRSGGLIWLNDADSENKKETVAYLMKHCRWLPDQSLGINCVVFEKIQEPILPK